MDPKRSREILQRLGLCTLLAGALACATPSPRPVAQVEEPESVRPQYTGPKKTIAVARFDANGAFLSRYGDWDVGGGLAAQLASALGESDRFVLVERPELAQVLRQHQLALEGITTPNTSPAVGQLLGAQLLVRGSVTEFNEADNGGGFSIGAPIAGGFAGALGTRSSNGHVTIDLRVIDTTTGRVVATHTVDSDLSRTSLALTGDSDELSFGGDVFQRSALGAATREAIEEAVEFLEASLGNVPWSAQVAKVQAGEVYVNAGANANLQPGHTLAVYQVVDRVVDPITQEVLGLEEREIGSVVLEDIRPRYSRGMFIGNQLPDAGDVLRFTPGRAALGFSTGTQPGTPGGMR